MENVTLSQDQFKVIVDLLKNDIEDIANNPEFFEECGYNPKDFIDERIALCGLFKIDFWNTADLFCSPYVFARLKALYEGKSIKQFNENYETPSQADIQKGFLKALIKGKESSKK